MTAYQTCIAKRMIVFSQAVRAPDGVAFIMS